MLYVVGKVDHIRHPGADMLMYLSTHGCHIRCHIIWRNTTFSDLYHCSRQRTLYLEGSLIKIYFGFSRSQVFQTLHLTRNFSKSGGNEMDSVLYGVYKGKIYMYQERLNNYIVSARYKFRTDT